MKDFNKISDFIDGDLSSAEKAEFEQSVNQDPNLKADVNRHQMLVEGIKAARHNELKTRLAAIPVSAGVAMRTKIAVGVASVFTAGLMFFGYQKLNQPITEETIRATEVTSVVKEQPQTTEEILIPATTETITETNNTTITEVKAENTSAKRPSTVKNKPVSSTENTLNQVIPNASDYTNPFDELADNERLKKSDGTAHKDNINSAKKITKTIISPKIESSKTLQYLYDNNNLTLYGDFSTDEYLVLDYRHIDKVFLYFNDSFYELEVKKRKSLLKNSIVTDPTLQAQLRAELQQ